MIPTEPGIHYGIPFADYLKIDAVSASALKEIRVSPRHYWRKRQRPDQDCDAYRVGRAGHTAILEPDRFLREYVLWDAKAKNGSGKKAPRRGEQWDTFLSMHAGKSILTDEQYDLALAMRDAAREHPTVSRWLAVPGKHEVTLIWDDPRTGVRCKARLDRVTADAIDDVKTTNDPAPHKFAATAARLGYHVQAAHYSAGWHTLTGELLPFRFLVAQSREAFDVVPYEATDDFMAQGEAEAASMLDLLIQCRERNEWPGISPEPVKLALPAWAMAEDDDLELTFNGESLEV